ncbi:Lactosylceramide 4-alpha-galactosyltransferase (Fragment) [Linum perenne]
MNVKEQDESSEAVDPLVPPVNVTIEGRIEWFKQKLPQLDLLNSNELSSNFHDRVVDFFSNNCSVQFYMVWLSPAKTFGPREFLAVDTLFHSNPNACLVIVSRSMDSDHGTRKLQPLLDLGFKGTPGEDWLADMKSGTKDPGYIPLTINLSNLIRIAMIYKYGGAYLDTDFIVLKDFSGLKNAVGAQSIDSTTNEWTSINNAVIIFDRGHPIVLEFIKEFANTFNGNKWGHNGPAMFTRVFERVGRQTDYNVTIMPPKAFYPVDWIEIRKLFKMPMTSSRSRWADQLLVDLQDSYALHLWNKRSRQLIIEEGSVMDRLISDHCVVCQHINHA